MAERTEISRKLLVIGVALLLLCGWPMGCAKPELEKVEITPGDQKLAVGESVTFKAKGISNKGKEMPEAAFRWQAQGEAGTMGENGQFTAIKPGTATVKAVSGPISGTATVTVHPVAAATISVHPEKEKALPETVIRLTIKALSKEEKPAGYNVVRISSPTEGVRLSSDAVTLGPEGEGAAEVTLAPSPGNNTIVLKTDGVTREMVLEGTALTRIVVLPDQNEFEAGQRVDFHAEGYDALGNHRAVEAQWSLAADNAVLEEDGRVVMKAPGEGSILARFQDLSQGRLFRVVPGKTARLAAEPQEIRLQAGQTERIGIRGFNAFGYPLPVEVEWSVTDGLGTISKDGTFLAKKTGKGTLAAAQEGVSVQVSVTVEHGPLSDIRIPMEKAEMEAGESVKLSAVGVDAFGNEFPVKPQWVLSKSLGTIDPEKELFTAQYAGSGNIRAEVGNIVNLHPIRVIPSRPATLELKPENADIPAGETIAFEVIGYDRFGNRVPIEPVFSMGADLGTLGPAGAFQGKKAGNTWIEAGVGEIKDRSTISVTPANMVTAMIAPKGHLFLKAGQAVRFSAYGQDAFGNTVASDISWKMEPELGTLDEKGVLLATRPVEGMVSAHIRELRTGNTLIISVPVSVAPGEPAEIRIEPKQAEVTAGKELPFRTTILDTYGNETSGQVQWSVIGHPIGDIETTGLFRAVKAGTGSVRAATGSVTAEAAVRVMPAAIVFLKVAPESISAKAGEKVLLEAMGEDRFGNTVDARVIWSITDRDLGTVTADNVFTARREGKGFLLAASGDIVEKVSLTVEKGPLAAIAVDPSEKTLKAGETADFSARGVDAGGNAIGFEASWSLPDNVGSIDKKGKVAAKTAGKTRVKVEGNGVAGFAELQVVPGEPAVVDVNPESIQAVAGDSVAIQYKVFDAHNNLISQPELRWEVKNGMGIVTGENRFAARKAGKGAVRLEVGKAFAEIPAEVAAGQVHVIHVTPDVLEIHAGQQSQFTAKAYDRFGNEAHLEPVWGVSAGLGVIGGKGLFDARTTGTGYVSCQMGDISGISRVQVKPGPVVRIELEPADAALTAGNSYAFSASAYDAQENKSPAEFTWRLESPEPFGIFLSPGRFVARRTGAGKIAASSGQVEGYADIRVEHAPLKKLAVSPERLTIRSGEEALLKVTGKDGFGNLFPVSVRWAVTPAELGTVTGEGAFTARKAGKGAIIASSDGVEDLVPVTVEPGELQRLAILEPPGGILAGKSYPFEALGYDAGGNVIPVKPRWAATRDIGEIDGETGVFHARRVGKGTVAVYSHQVMDSLPIEVKAGETAFVFIEPNPVTVISGKLQKFAAKGFDIEKNPVENLPELKWIVEGGVGFFEEPGIFRGTREGNGKVSAGNGNLRAESYVSVVPGEPDPGNSRIRVIRPRVPADGKAAAEILLEIKDASENPVPKAEVTLISDRQEDTIVQPAETGPEGKAVGRIFSHQAGTSLIGAVVKGQAVRDTAEVVFVGP